MDAAVQEAKDQAELNELLIWASARGLFADAAELIARGAEPKVKDKQGLTPAHYAAAQGHLDVLQYLATKGADLEAEDPHARMPLHHAAISENVEVLRYLIQNSTWLDSADAADDTALHLVARRGWVPGLKLLLAAGAAVNIPNKRGLTALGEAVVGRHVAAVKILLQAEADATCRAAGYTLLHVAAGLGQAKALHLLLQHPASSTLVNDTANDDSATPLHAAAMAGCLQCVQLLLEHGADAGVAGSGGLLPWELLANASTGPTNWQQLKTILQEAARNSNHGSRTKQSPSAIVNTPELSKVTASATVAQDDISTLGPVKAYSKQFAVLNSTEQGRKVDAFARMSEAELLQLGFLSENAKHAISQVRRAQQLLGCYRAVAALRSDEAFQEDASDPVVQDALEEIKLTNSFEKYKDDRQVMSVAAKLKKFHTVLQECGGVRMGLQDLLVKPGQTLEQLMAQDAKQIEGLTAAAAQARIAAVTAITGQPRSTPAAPATAAHTGTADKLSEAEKTANSEIEAAESDTGTASDLDLDAQLQQAKAAAAAAKPKRKHPDEMQFRERMLYEVVNSFKQAVKIMSMAILLWGIMWLAGMLPGQQDPKLIEERMLQIMQAKEQAAQQQDAMQAGAASGRGPEL